MDDQNKNLILATALSFLVILVWFVLFPPPEQTTTPDSTEISTTAETEVQTPSAAGTTTVDETTAAAAEAQPEAQAPRVQIDTPRLSGSLSLSGGRIDELFLKDYKVSLAEDAPIVELLSPVGSESAYYALYGWAPGAGLSGTDVPGPNTLWSVEQGETLGVDSPITLVWDNGNGLTFRRTVSVDENYMFSVTQSVENASNASVAMAPYGILARHGIGEDGDIPELKNFFILHEGLISMADGTLNEVDYGDIQDGVESLEGINEGWIGFTDHYWMTTLIPEQGTEFTASAGFNTQNKVYQADIKTPTLTVAAGESAQVTTRLFAGAKEWDAIREYQAEGVQKFIDSIDWGWFFFLTKPIFWLLHNINVLIGNMGWSIIGLTLIIKAILFPLAFKSYVSMAKMKELQPQMEALKEAAGDDRQKMQQGMMELYKKEKVNPAAGCLPILMQIPIFFSLYKVIFVTIELRQAPWFGPFQDLSAPDPTSIMNLFGLLPWAGPQPDTFMALIFLGILPILLGISMWLQQKLNPAPTDPTQAMIFAWMPWVFMFMLGSFASGLVVYWIANNTITFTQQYLIMRSQGYKPDVFGNIKSSFKRTPKTDDK
ncbi:insertase [Ruegeria sp. ANG-S4]|uniref:membrane protein insertase YidC n=1 Tax=Ruegeria sp. ANG-S4 TaxID=1577904 RepID=UPI00057DFA15|nr:membrane protein insertase YidC [Ruegeria sp. ANG-S4]KIC46684.1 insertase [Ruegeria sp. ANG-S4]